MAVKVKKQITVALENRPGRLALVSECLAKWKVNILGISVAETADLCVVRLLVDKPADVLKNFKKCCPFGASERDVLVVDAPNRPGALAKLSKKLAARRINIDYVYGTTPKKGSATIVFGVNNPKTAAKALRR